jgi:hypothetical protein
MLSHARFLRVSSDANDLEFDIGLIASGAIPPIDGGAALAAFTDAITVDHLSDLTTVRADLVSALGAVGAERVVSIASTFQMMNRALDGVGAPVGADLHPIAKQLGFEPTDITR